RSTRNSIRRKKARQSGQRSRASSLLSPAYDDVRGHRRSAMRKKALTVISLLAGGAIVTTASLQWVSSGDAQTQTRQRYLPEYTNSGDLILPKDFHEWVYVGSPLTPNALNGGSAGFPEFHNVYIEPGSYEIFKKTNQFPEGTILFKELQLTLQ